MRAAILLVLLSVLNHCWAAMPVEHFEVPFFQTQEESTAFADKVASLEERHLGSVSFEKSPAHHHVVDSFGESSFTTEAVSPPNYWFFAPKKSTTPTRAPTRGTPTRGPTLRPPTMGPTTTPTQPPVPSVPPIIIGGEPLRIPDAVNLAVRTGDAAGVTGAQLRQSIYQTMDTLTAMKNLTVRDMFTMSNGTRITGMTWDPSHDSIVFTISDESAAFPVLKSNEDYGNYPETGNFQTIAVAGVGATRNRFVALANNPFIGNTNAAFMAGVKGMIRWLNHGVDPRDVPKFNVTIAHLPGASSYWFSHDVPTKAWFNTNYPSAKVNNMNTCENAALAGCLAKSQLLVIGRQIGKVDDTAAPLSTFDGPAVAAIVKDFMARGGSVLYVHYYRDGNAMTDVLFPLFGISPPAVGSSSNYWRSSGLLLADPIASVWGSVVPNPLRNMLDTLSGKTPLLTSDLATCRAGDWLTRTDAWHVCTTPEFVSKLAGGALALRATLNDLDTNNIAIFNGTASSSIVSKLFVLLGDKHRAGLGLTDASTKLIRYPVNFTANDMFAAAVFSDVSILYSRAVAPAQNDLGSLYCTFNSVYKSNCRGTPRDHRVWAPTVLHHNNQLVEMPIDYGVNVWTSTGYFALPGEAIRVRRTDSRADVKVSVVFWYQKDKTTKALYSSDGVRSSYVRPSFVRSPTMNVPASGKQVLFNSPRGGPIYLYLQLISGVAAGSGPIRLVFDNVGKHSSILDVGNSTQLSLFGYQISKNPIPIVDIKSAGFEMHMRADFFTGSLKYLDFMMDYSGPNGVALLLHDFRVNFLEKQFALAGFKAPGKSLKASLSPVVLEICSSLGWNCTDEKTHVYNGIQHANYDDYASCGNGCSGNPFDMDWTMTPVGWGESHELGHNMQTSLLNIGWAPATSNKNAWSSYRDRAAENSNNIFPYYLRWQFYRFYKSYAGVTPDGRTGHKETFAILQSALARVNATVNGVKRAVTLTTKCKIKSDFPLGTSPAQVARDTIYSNSAYAADNDARMSFYLQLPLLLAGRTLRNNKVMTDGFDIVTLMYQNSRLFRAAAANDALWLSRRAALGFDLFNRTCASTTRCYATYGSSSVTSMFGNDFVLVSLTFITGFDFRPYFDIRGVQYTNLASEQVDRHVASGAASLGPIPTTFYVLEDYPPTSLIGLPTTSLNGVAAWTVNNWTPASCTNPTY